MPMYAVNANELKVHFNQEVYLTFKMHSDLNMDLIRWLQSQTKRLDLLSKRADKIEKSAVDVEDDDQFLALTEQAEALRSKGGDMIDVMVTYIKRACLGWTDYYEDEAAVQRQEVLSFDERNIARIGVSKLSKIIVAFNEHYGLSETHPGEVKGESSPALSPSKEGAVSSQTGTSIT